MNWHTNSGKYQGHRNKNPRRYATDTLSHQPSHAGKKTSIYLHTGPMPLAYIDAVRVIAEHVPSAPHREQPSMALLAHQLAVDHHTAGTQTHDHIEKTSKHKVLRSKVEHTHERAQTYDMLGVEQCTHMSEHIATKGRYKNQRIRGVINKAFDTHANPLSPKGERGVVDIKPGGSTTGYLFMQ